MKKKYITDSIGIEIEIGDDGALKGIEIVEIDPEVFPPLAIENKTRMSWFVHAMTRMIMENLSDPRFLRGQQGTGATVKQGEEIQIVKCKQCGTEIPAKRPCCSAKTSTELCPGCHQPVLIEWK